MERWTLLLCVDPAAPACGDGTRNGAEECDDGNASNADACSNTCLVLDGCDDGNIDAAEQCDDNNVVSGDGCSATCQLDISCGAGETVVISNLTSRALPERCLTLAEPQRRAERSLGGAGELGRFFLPLLQNLWRTPCTCFTGGFGGGSKWVSTW